MFQSRALGTLLLAIAFAGPFGIACGGTVGRGTPAPDRVQASPTGGQATSGPTATSRASPIPTPTRSPTPGTVATTGTSPTPAGTVTSVPKLTPTRSALPTATPKPVVVDAAATVSTELTLDIFGVGEETIVRGSSIIVAGRTRPDAVLSINGVIIPMDAEGRFEVTVALNPGPNLIEVVASDLDGNQKSRVLTVIALPEA